MKFNKSFLFILYVNDQNFSKIFYKNLLKIEPVLDVPGMTEFEINETCKFGIMPNKSIAKIINIKIPHPDFWDIPRCELYFYVEDIISEYENAIKCGATLLSSISVRDWGDKVAYFSDPDGHIIALAETIPPH